MRVASLFLLVAIIGLGVIFTIVGSYQSALRNRAASFNDGFSRTDVRKLLGKLEDLQGEIVDLRKATLRGLQEKDETPTERVIRGHPASVDDFSTLNYQNWERVRLNRYREYNTYPCSDAQSTDANHEGVDFLTKYVRDGYLQSTQAPDQAFKYFTLALHYDPKCTTAKLNMAILSLFQRDLDAVKKWTAEIISEEPQHARAYLYQGFATELAGQEPQTLYELARRHTKALSLDFFGVRSGYDTSLRFFTPLSPNPKLTDAGRKLQITALLRLLLAKEYQHLALSGTVDLSREKAVRFNSSGVIPLPTMLTGYALQTYQQLWWDMLAYDQIEYSDPQVHSRYHYHNDPVTRFIHAQYSDVVQRVAGRPTKPSYTYFASYTGGSVLAPHTDRLACEFTLTFQIDLKPEEPLWPFCVKSSPLSIEATERGGSRDRPPSQQEDKLLFAPGDGGLIWGRRIVHYRDALPAQQRSTNVFMHYVYADYPEEEFGK
eukprot:TRINITY_DN67571_c9_g7_i1.p1 TRINITY_DN67571_c9_g7~~TRINITY_DN67571_c9_g7_i1.p1  ORF type:complete len:489 (+),score=34.69 TRINITY_DN67571_c9_g7_i1:71-1537(+)